MPKKFCFKTDVPDWSNGVLQGLAFWVGYKKQHYHEYPIREGEIVGETLSLLSSKLDSNFQLNAEVMYRDLCNEWEDNGRADIVISSKNENFDYKDDALFIIEVKRKEANKKEIKKDLERLAKFLEISKNKNLRCFMLFVSQDTRPADYVKEDGSAKRNIISIAGMPKYKARTRKVKKAIDKFYMYKKDKNGNKTKIFNAADKAHYACLIEVAKVCEN